MNPFENARDEAKNASNKRGSDVTTVEAVTDNVAAVTFVDGDRPFRATVPDSLTVGADDTVIVGYTTSGSAYIENVLTRTAEPEPTPAAVEPGRFFYSGDSVSDTIYTYKCSTPFDIDTASFQSVTDVSDDVSRLVGFVWNNTGDKFYTVDVSPDIVASFTAPEPFRVADATLDKTLDASDPGFGPTNVTWSNDGSVLYLPDYDEEVYQYRCSTPFDIGTAALETSFDTSDEASECYDIAWDSDGTTFFTVEDGYNIIYAYTCSTPFDVDTATFDTSIDLSDELESESIAWNNDGTTLYVASNSNNTIYAYTCSTPFDIDTATLETSFTVSNDRDIDTITWNGLPQYDGFNSFNK